MTREEAIAILEVSKHMATSGRLYNQAIDMAIEALHREEAEANGYCHRIKPKEYFSADADRPKVIGIDYSPYRIQTTAPSAEQVISKLNNPCNSFLTEESNGSKEHKSKLDLISRQDVIEALCRSSIYAWSIEQDQTAHDWALNIIKALPSADAMPTVIRSKTFMRKEDFDKWADDIKKQNKSIVCIPCDAEVVSADSVVRCKDCKYSFYDNDYESYNCRKHEYVECFDADDYCSWGERND